MEEPLETLPGDAAPRECFQREAGGRGEKAEGTA